MPSWPTSSSRPMNGLTYVAPALAAMRHCMLEKQSVTLVRMPSLARRRTATMPASIIGIFTTMLSAILASSWPSRTIASVSTATTSAETGPYQGADLLEDVAGVQVTRLFREQRGVGGDPVDQPGLGRPADVLEARGIEKELHGSGLGVEVSGIAHRHEIESLRRGGRAERLVVGRR